MQETLYPVDGWFLSAAWVVRSFPSQALNILYFTNRWRCFPPLRSEDLALSQGTCFSQEETPEGGV